MSNLRLSAKLRRLLLPVALVAIVSFGISGLYQASAGASTISFQTVRDCNSSAIINCGALTTGQLINAYSSTPYVQNVYAALGITSTSIKNLPTTATAGIINKNGSVYIGGQSAAVASGVVAANRLNVAGSKEVTTSGIHFYEVSPATVISGNVTDAYVVMTNHHFNYAIIASNGDPVIIKPSTTTKAAPSVHSTPAPASSASTTLTNTGPTTNMTVGLFGLTFLGATVLSYKYRLRRLQ